jgi:hypothetical protein
MDDTSYDMLAGLLYRHHRDVIEVRKHNDTIIIPLLYPSLGIVKYRVSLAGWNHVLDMVIAKHDKQYIYRTRIFIDTISRQIPLECIQKQAQEQSYSLIMRLQGKYCAYALNTPPKLILEILDKYFMT